MIEILRDSVWQFVGVVLALLSLGAAFVIYWLQRQTKELAFGLISSRRPIAIADELSSRVTVQLDGQTVEHLHLQVYGLKNSGHRPIAQTDFERPLSIAFEAGRIVSAEIATQRPTNLGAQLTISTSRIELAPLLLNPGDRLLIQVLLSSAKPASTLDARIFDVPSIGPINTIPPLPPFFRSGLPMLMWIMLAAGILGLIFMERREMAYAYLGFAAFIPVFGLVSRLWRDSGKSARRRISDD